MASAYVRPTGQRALQDALPGALRARLRPRADGHNDSDASAGKPPGYQEWKVIVAGTDMER